MKIVITGSEGGIGRYIATECLRQRPRDEIVRVTRNINFANDPGYEIGDLRHHSFVRKVVADADIVIHAAAWPYDRTDLNIRPLDIMANDIEATTALLAAIADRRTFNTGGHVVFLSSATVYEGSDERAPSEEDDRQMPSTVIGLSKAFSEHAIRTWEKQTAGVYTIWRLFNVVTPHEQHEEPGHIQTDLYRRIFVDHDPQLQLWDGDRMRCFTWVGDVAKSIVRYLDDERAWGNTFNLGSDEPLTAVELADTMLHVGHELGVLPDEYNPPITVLATERGGQSCLPSITKARIALNWKPETSSLACIEQFVKAKLEEAAKEAS